MAWMASQADCPAARRRRSSELRAHVQPLPAVAGTRWCRASATTGDPPGLMCCDSAQAMFAAKNTEMLDNKYVHFSNYVQRTPEVSFIWTRGPSSTWTKDPPPVCAMVPSSAGTMIHATSQIMFQKEHHSSTVSLWPPSAKGADVLEGPAARRRRPPEPCAHVQPLPAAAGTGWRLCKAWRTPPDREPPLTQCGLI
jgi:hypothetical protein